jgi:hypothetical protein
VGQEELLDTVRALRFRRYTPTEIARALGLRKAEAARLVQVVACERDSGPKAAGASATNGRATASQPRCWVSPGWRHGLRIEGHPEWPEGAGAPTEASDSGVACVLLALRRLLSLKNNAQYGLISLSMSRRNSVLRKARKLVELSQQVIAG